MMHSVFMGYFSVLLCADELLCACDTALVLLCDEMLCFCVVVYQCYVPVLMSCVQCCVPVLCADELCAVRRL